MIDTLSERDYGQEAYWGFWIYGFCRKVEQNEIKCFNVLLSLSLCLSLPVWEANPFDQQKQFQELLTGASCTVCLAWVQHCAK